MYRMDGRVAFAIGDVFSLSSSFDYRISKKFGSSQQRQGLLCEQWFETEKHVYSVHRGFFGGRMSLVTIY